MASEATKAANISRKSESGKEPGRALRARETLWLGVHPLVRICHVYPGPRGCGGGHRGCLSAQSGPLTCRLR